MRLALARGLSYDEFVDTTTSRELTEWEALNSMSPLFENRGDYHAAQICATIAAIFGKAPKIEDFLLRFDGRARNDKPRQTIEQQKAIARAFKAMFSQGKRA